MNGPLEWIAAIGTMLAAGIIAADLGRKATGFGFILFCVVAIVWVVAGIRDGVVPIIAMNAALLLINAWGVWQYLISRKNRKIMQRLAPERQRVEEQVEREARRE